MNFKNIIIILLIILNSCVNYPINVKENKPVIKKYYYSNKGFSLIYSNDLVKKKIINNIMDERSLIIFQQRLKNGTKVKITNLINNKTIIATVGKKSNYPALYNSVISPRISQTLELNVAEPYIEIIEIIGDSSFVSKKTITYNEEKTVASKAPVDKIIIKNLLNNKKNKINNKSKEFSYIIKVADFYFNKSAEEMLNKIKKETSIKKIEIIKLSSTKYRVFLGPFNNLNSLKKDFNDISTLQFENIEIIKN